MNYAEIQKIFNRAFWLTLSKKKNLFVFLILNLCGILIIFLKGIGMNQGAWLSLSFTFLPIFLCAGLLLSTGIILVRLYHDEIKNHQVSIREVLKKSWGLVLGTPYLIVPFLFAFLLLWIFLGIFYLLAEVPALGGFISIVFAFAPFLIVLSSLILALTTLFLLFFVPPAVGLHRGKGEIKLKVAQQIIKRIKFDIFGNITLFAIAIAPAIIILGGLSLAAIWAGSSEANHLYIILQWFFVMFPFTALLSPAVIFFFNFSTESHVLMQKLQKQPSES